MITSIRDICSHTETIEVEYALVETILYMNATSTPHRQATVPVWKRRRRLLVPVRTVRLEGISRRRTDIVLILHDMLGVPCMPGRNRFRTNCDLASFRAHNGAPIHLPLQFLQVWYHRPETLLATTTFGTLEFTT
jgi:hypothetical protein